MDERDSPTVGFIGLGSQGGPIARRLIDAGYAVTLWARRAETLEPFRNSSAKFASSVAELGKQCAAVGICVVDDNGVREMCEALIPAMAPGGRIAVHSTVHPDTCITLANQASAHGLSLIDAPVSGGGQSAAEGNLTVMVGGEADAVAAARPMFETFAGLILHLGGVGAGQMAKLVNNALMAANMGLSHGALSVGDKLGLNREALVELVKASSGRSFGFDVYARLPQPSAFAHGASLLSKDVRLLGEVMGADDAFESLRDAAAIFLDLVQPAGRDT